MHLSCCSLLAMATLYTLDWYYRNHTRRALLLSEDQFNSSTGRIFNWPNELSTGEGNGLLLPVWKQITPKPGTFSAQMCLFTNIVSKMQASIHRRHYNNVLTAIVQYSTVAHLANSTSTQCRRMCASKTKSECTLCSRYIRAVANVVFTNNILQEHDKADALGADFAGARPRQTRNTESASSDENDTRHALLGVASMELPDLNASIDERYCWGTSCDYLNGNYTLYIPVSPHMPHIPVNIHFMYAFCLHKAH